jgi:hypothetical protein
MQPFEKNGNTDVEGMNTLNDYNVVALVNAIVWIQS